MATQHRAPTSFTLYSQTSLLCKVYDLGTSNHRSGLLFYVQRIKTMGTIHGQSSHSLSMTLICQLMSKTWSQASTVLPGVVKMAHHRDHHSQIHHQGLQSRAGIPFSLRCLPLSCRPNSLGCTLIEEGFRHYHLHHLHHHHKRALNQTLEP